MSANFSIRIDINKARNGLDKLPDAVVRAVDPKLARGAEEVARTAKNTAPKAFSNLVNSIRSDKIDVLHYCVSENEKYGRAVEEGSRPHFPDSKNLIPWVERVLGYRGKEASRTAFVIARAISRRGTPRQTYMQAASEVESWRVRELVLAGVDQGIKESFA